MCGIRAALVIFVLTILPKGKLEGLGFRVLGLWV